LLGIPVTHFGHFFFFQFILIHPLLNRRLSRLLKKMAQKGGKPTGVAAAQNMFQFKLVLLGKSPPFQVFHEVLTVLFTPLHCSLVQVTRLWESPLWF